MEDNMERGLMAKAHYPANMPEITVYYDAVRMDVEITDIYVNGIETAGYLYDGLMSQFGQIWTEEIINFKEEQYREYQAEKAEAMLELCSS
jgi:hypothetical protein